MDLIAHRPTADPDYLNGHISVNNLTLQLDSGQYRIDTSLMNAAATDTLKTIGLRSEFMHVALAGNFTTSGLVPAIMEHANRYFAAADSLSSLSQPLVTANADTRSEEHTSELQSLMRISYAVFCLKHKNKMNKYNL